MAIQEHLHRLQQEVDIWNIWRMEHPETTLDLSRANLGGVNLRGANLSRADLSEANLSEANLSEVNLSGANLSGANLSGAYLNGATLSDANLSEANLQRTILQGANLNRTDLTKAQLSSVNLRGAILTRATLTKADLSYANLNHANLSEARLNHADLSYADLNYTNLNHADLSYANLDGTTISRAILCNLDMKLVKGLNTIKHIGPSSVGTDTLERSEGTIPDIFLRGVGLSDIFITYARALVQSPIQYYTCFISYSSKDELFAHRLHNDLQQEGVRCWFAPEDMDIGDKIKYRIDESIRLYDKLLLILSEYSIASSWVAYEVERALNKEPHGVPDVLYPVRVDQAILTCTTNWAQDIKETRHIGDFEHWIDPEKYQVSFQRLLRALRGKPEQGKG